MNETEIGKVAHYYTKIGVAIIELTDALKVGETIHIQGATTDFEQVVESMQIEHESIDEAKAGDVVGLKIKEKVREGDIVSKK
ncbi:translation elongation factor-like protein [Candidatus Parcubacteria bacterium]|nr:translation elongation factor-like protein [Candidatus Parcubacteria bacterium]